MELFRSESQQNFQDLYKTLVEGSHIFLQYSEWIDTAELKRLFLGLSQRKQTWADRVAKGITEQGDLPADCDPDLEVVQLFLQHMDASMSESFAKEVVQKALDEEHRLKKALEIVLADSSRINEAMQLSGLQKEIASNLDVLEEKLRLL